MAKLDANNANIQVLVQNPIQKEEDQLRRSERVSAKKVGATEPPDKIEKVKKVKQEWS